MLVPAPEPSVARTPTSNKPRIGMSGRSFMMARFYALLTSAWAMDVVFVVMRDALARGARDPPEDAAPSTCRGRDANLSAGASLGEKCCADGAPRRCERSPGLGRPPPDTRDGAPTPAAGTGVGGRTNLGGTWAPIYPPHPRPAELRMSLFDRVVVASRARGAREPCPGHVRPSCGRSAAVIGAARRWAGSALRAGQPCPRGA